METTTVLANPVRQQDKGKVRCSQRQWLLRLRSQQERSSIVSLVNKPLAGQVSTKLSAPGQNFNGAVVSVGGNKNPGYLPAWFGYIEVGKPVENDHTFQSLHF